MNRSIIVPIALFLFVGFGFSCMFLPVKIYNMQTSLDVTNQLLKWQLDNTTHVFEYNSNVYVHVFYKEDSLRSFYLDEESNLMIASMLCYTFQEKFSEYDSVKFEMEFEGYPDVLNVGYDQEKIEEIKSHFDNTSFFYDFVEYSFIHFGYMEVLRSTQLIKFFSEDFNDFFKFSGSYWLLLYKYCEASQDPPNHFDSIFCFLWFASDAKDYVPIDNVDLFDEHMKYFLRPFGYDEALLNENFIGILEHLNEKFDRQK